MKPWQYFEQQITTANDFYRRKGWGAIEKIPNDMKTIRMNGRMMSVPSGKTGCDFIGVYKSLPVAIEAKSTQKKSLPLMAQNGPMIKDHQVKFLKDFQQSGGKAFLIVKFVTVNRCFLLSIDEYSELKLKALERNRKSIPIADFAGHQVNERGYILDYLQGVDLV
ncbi:MAG: Holliday junction resolvase RecU [Carnobacterium maltaromaticum]